MGAGTGSEELLCLLPSDVPIESSFHEGWSRTALGSSNQVLDIVVDVMNRGSRPFHPSRSRVGGRSIPDDRDLPSGSPKALLQTAAWRLEMFQNVEAVVADVFDTLGSQLIWIPLECWTHTAAKLATAWHLNRLT